MMNTGKSAGSRSGEEERTRLTLEALADVDAGGVVGQQAVQAWADSLGSGSPFPLPLPTSGQ